MTLVEPCDSLLVVDVGNTRIGLAVWDSDGLHDTQRIDVTSESAWRSAAASAWDLIPAKRRAVVLGSVNPRTACRVQALIEDVTGKDVVRVRDDIPLPMPLDIDNDDEVGVDRVCACAAAFEHIGGACAVASFGTATTVDCVSPDGRFLGGAILPGFEMSLAALHEHTAQLPHVELVRPNGVYGRNTRDAILNGVTYGLVGALREIVERFATDLREWPQLVITGGNAPLVAELSDFVDAVVPDLCLMGIALAHRRAAGQS